MPQVIPLTSCIITCGQKQKRQNEIICTFLMDAMLSEHHVTRFDVWSQTGLMKNGRQAWLLPKQKLPDSRSIILQTTPPTWYTPCGHNTVLV